MRFIIRSACLVSVVSAFLLVLGIVDVSLFVFFGLFRDGRLVLSYFVCVWWVSDLVIVRLTVLVLFWRINIYLVLLVRPWCCFPSHTGFSEVAVLLVHRTGRCSFRCPSFQLCPMIHVLGFHVCALDVSLPTSWYWSSAFQGPLLSCRVVSCCSWWCFCSCFVLSSSLLGPEWSSSLSLWCSDHPVPISCLIWLVPQFVCSSSMFRLGGTVECRGGIS